MNHFEDRLEVLHPHGCSAFTESLRGREALGGSEGGGASEEVNVENKCHMSRRVNFIRSKVEI